MFPKIHRTVLRVSTYFEPKYICANHMHRRLKSFLPRMARERRIPFVVAHEIDPEALDVMKHHGMATSVFYDKELGYTMIAYPSTLGRISTAREGYVPSLDIGIREHCAILHLAATNDGEKEQDMLPSDAAILHSTLPHGQQKGLGMAFTSELADCTPVHMYVSPNTSYYRIQKKGDILYSAFNFLI